MKKTIRYLLSGLALLSLGACTSSDNEDGSGGNDGGLTFVTVVSFNIRVDNAADGDNAWDNRKPASAAMIRQERPTVMGLQEAQPHQITYLAKNCPDRRGPSCFSATAADYLSVRATRFSLMRAFLPVRSRR